MAKLVVYAAILAMVLGFITAFSNSRYKAGYTAAQVEQANATEAAVAAAESRVSDNLRGVIAHKEKERKAAWRLVSQLRASKKEVIYRDIERISTTQCDRLGDDFKRVFNAIVGEPPDGGNTGGKYGSGSDTPARTGYTPELPSPMSVAD